jgi:hypothetical protein
MAAMNATKLLTFFAANVAKCFFASIVSMPMIGESIFILLIAGVILWVAILDFATRNDRNIR